MAVPEGVYFISGSRVRRPASVTLLMFIDRQNEGPDTEDNVLPAANVATENQKTISHGSTPTRMEKDPLLERLCATDIFLPSRRPDIVVLFDPSDRLFIPSLTTRETHPETQLSICQHNCTLLLSLFIAPQPPTNTRPSA